HVVCAKLFLSCIWTCLLRILDVVVGKPTISYHEVRLFLIPRYKLSGTPGIARGFQKIQIKYPEHPKVRGTLILSTYKNFTQTTSGTSTSESNFVNFPVS